MGGNICSSVTKIRHSKTKNSYLQDKAYNPKVISNSNNSNAISNQNQMNYNPTPSNDKSNSPSEIILWQFENIAREINLHYFQTNQSNADLLQNENNIENNQIEIKKYHLLKDPICADCSCKIYKTIIEDYNELNGTLMAVKFIKKKGSNKEEIQNEIDILSRMNHPNIVRYYSSLEQQEEHLIFMEYCENGSWEGIIKSFQNIEERIIQKYTKEILEGLAYLHSNEIIHRDIKCANIWLDQNGVCKITDFGVSKSLKNVSKYVDGITGTVQWSAPENFKYKCSYYSDIWSWGCTILEMATGKRPWHEMDFKSVIEWENYWRDVKERPKCSEKWSDECLNFIENCMKINPTERWTVNELKKHPFITGKKSTWKWCTSGSDLEPKHGDEKENNEDNKNETDIMMNETDQMFQSG